VQVSLSSSSRRVLGSGGHTSEMLALLGALDLSRYTPRHYVLADTDDHSAQKLNAFEGTPSSFFVHIIPRSREVKQGLLSALLPTMAACLQSLKLLLQIRPDLLLCNGPGTCVPVCFAVSLLKLLGIHQAQIVFVETIARVQDLSLSGKILLRVADHFLVQWPQLAEKYPKTHYLGRLC